MPYVVTNVLGLPKGTPIVSMKQDDGTMRRFYEGDHVTKRDFNEAGWERLTTDGYIVQKRGGS